MLNLISSFRIRRLLRTKRFANALAYCRTNNSHISNDEMWTLYKTGCYQWAANSSCRPTTPEAVLAFGVSLITCGRTDEGASVLRNGLKMLEAKPKLLSEAARLVAQYSPELSAELLSSHQFLNPGLMIALHVELGNVAAARELCDAYFQTNDKRKDNDIFLIMANLEAGIPEKLSYINTCLDAHKLTRVEARAGAVSLSANTITASRRNAETDGPLVSIVVPAYNTADRIAASVESLCGQSYENLEIVVVDDCSTDDTLSVVESLAQRDRRIRVFKTGSNSGPYVARNIGLENARGEFVTCHDSDDWAHPDKIHLQLKPMLSDNSLKFTTSKWVRITDDGNFYVRQFYPITRLNPASPMFRRQETLDRVGFYENARTGADSEYIARLKLVYGPGSWKGIHKPLVFGAYRAGSLTTDLTTGGGRGVAMNAERLTYWEQWRKRHAEALRNGKTLYLGKDQASDS